MYFNYRERRQLTLEMLLDLQELGVDVGEDIVDAEIALERDHA